jgi:GTPase SAR1 family protein
MEDLLWLEREVQAVYDRTLQPLATRLAIELPVTGRDAPGLPTVLFLGNHSSGKSTFINHLIGEEIQKTGLAPTDDGFTLLIHGRQQDVFDGQTVVSHPALAYRSLQRLGPAFLAHLRLKTHPSELLESVSLIDSPGMIDAAGSGESRGYNFVAGVRSLSEMADLILIFFDPDKPGTTGETMSIFIETLAGLEHKLLIVLNKVDLFPNIRDFARTYGTLCWNLSKTIKTKDVPHIFTTYLPDPARSRPRPEPPPIPLKDFDAAREEIIAEIQRAPTRRADNLVSDLLAHARALSMQARVSRSIASHFQRLQINRCGLTLLPPLLATITLALAWNHAAWTTSALVALAGIVLALGAWFGGGWYLRRRQAALATPSGLDPFFHLAFRRELGLHERADLRALWETVRTATLRSLQVLGPRGLPYPWTIRKPLRQLDHVIDSQIPKLRRKIGGHRQPERAG